MRTGTITNRNTILLTLFPIPRPSVPNLVIILVFKCTCIEKKAEAKTLNELRRNNAFRNCTNFDYIYITMSC